MKIVRFNDLSFIPASHEDPKDPGALKKILLKQGDLPEGRIQMINWARLPKGKTFAPHYHEHMIEVFIIMNGKVRAKIDNDEAVLEKGDMVIAREREIHSFENLSDEDVDYLAMGVVTSEGGKTVNV
ncbi:cupin domain-containing protein [Candidatus Daviesbacteria bacterium]|nr:cupin domain-containing protein [Candidatus Daviesbacteria bacterium]